MVDRKIKEKLVEALRKNGLKLTRQRLAIIEVLASDRSHPSARTIWQQVRENEPSVSFSTVYYTLNLFKSKGLIKELEFYDMENRYEGLITDHLDLVCQGCGRIMNYDEPLPLPKEAVEKKTGFAVERVRYEYYGYCRECREKGRK